MRVAYKPFADKPTFIESVSSLFEVPTEQADRVDAVQRITDEYFARMGEWPDGIQLSRLGTYLLRDTPEEKAMRETVVLSRRQLEYRTEKEVPLDPARASICIEYRLKGRRKKKMEIEV